MTDPQADDLEARVLILERAVGRLRELAALSGSDAAAARVLAGGADRDVSDVRAEVRAHTRSLNALRETQLEQGQAIAALRADLTGLDAKVTGLDAKVTGLDAKVTGLDVEMRAGFATMGAGMSQIVALLTNRERPGQE